MSFFDKLKNQAMGDRLFEIMTDMSAQIWPQFSVRCEECGRIWKSAQIALTKSAASLATDDKKIIYETLLGREVSRAKRLAIGEAQQLFSICPVCGRVICDACFRVCENVDMCRTCAEKLGEDGVSPLEWCGEGDGDSS